MNISDLFFGEQNIEPTTITIYQGNTPVQQQQNIMPDELLEAQFKQLCIQIKQSGQPMKVRMSRMQWVEGRSTPLENYIEYQTWKDD